MRSILSDRLSSPPVAACLAIAGVVGGVLVGEGGLDTVVGCGMNSDYYPSQTAKDWVDNADHVVVATPIREQDTNRRDFTEGPTHYTTDRLVTFRADDVLWSADRPKSPLGDNFDMVTDGWRAKRDSGRRLKRTTPEAPRLEPGHSYILALRWAEDQWVVLGEGAAVPYDDNIAGQGEWCGRTLSKEDIASAERFSRQDDNSLEKTVLGQDKQAVIRELKQAGG
ncbi:hypothetical protein ACIQNG_26240 [Streptomyces sp. NPDC091377]|uniref:hypothetical protein n=1 Tax=Streptomyces sp. NPDC091377 TaxID=3365995 RepID=UPI0037FB32F8